ncbi:hypothetical protein BYT27DRAFT_7077737 [Phlegmacium glaucopus]|nr:hypothetical protein BYT27DRAFT_7077737 [Phlegmacium glaucopus]
MDLDHESLYLTELIYLGNGCPVWEPNPDTLYDCVRIGDVGYFQNGTFVPLFNILLPPNSNQDRGLPFPPPNFPPLRLPSNSTYRRNPLRAGVHALETSLTFSISGGVDSPGSVLHGETSLTFTNEKGAALILPYQAQREDAINNWPFKRHMLSNYRHWSNFAETTCELERGTRLILVTGCDLTLQWATATYCRNNREIALAGGGGVASVADAHFSLSAGWRVNQPMNTRQGPPQVQEESGPLMNNQCVFLRGFYIKDRFLFGPKVLKAGAGYHDPGKHGPEEEGVEGLLTDEDITVESLSPLTQHESLIMVLLDYMLEESDADIVIAHDSDLLPYLQGKASRENLREILRKMSPHIKVEDGGRCQYLNPT